jgi:hypothetical protein
MGDQALLDEYDVMGPVLAQALVATGQMDVLHPRAPGQPVLVAGHRLDQHLTLEPGQTGELFLDDARLEPALLGQLDVLEVAAPAPTRVRERTRRPNAMGRRHGHVHRVAAQEPPAVLCDLDRDVLPRQRVPNEDHHLALVETGRDPGNEVPAVRNRADLHLEALTDQ